MTSIKEIHQLIMSRKFDEADRQIATGITEEPDNADYYYCRARAYYSTGKYLNSKEQYQDALNDYDKAVKLGKKLAADDNSGRAEMIEALKH